MILSQLIFRRRERTLCPSTYTAPFLRALFVLLVGPFIVRNLYKNGIRNDNRIENLELWITSQPSGQRVADLLSWAKDILATYSDIESLL